MLQCFMEPTINKPGERQGPDVASLPIGAVIIHSVNIFGSRSTSDIFKTKRVLSNVLAKLHRGPQDACAASLYALRLGNCGSNMGRFFEGS
jgi:hypothetical protein